MITDESLNPQHLSITDPASIQLAAERIADGEIVIAGFNGIFVILGDADRPDVADKITVVKNRPHSKTVALVCPPEYLAEHVDLQALEQYHPFSQVLRLYRSVPAIGLILPAAIPGAPPHVVQAGTILNVWTEYPPHQPLRRLVSALRSHGKRALVGTSANKAGQPTLTDPRQAVATFGREIGLMLLDTFETTPVQYRRSTSIIDFTGPQTRLHRIGSLSAQELQERLSPLGLGELTIGPEVLMA